MVFRGWGRAPRIRLRQTAYKRRERERERGGERDRDRERDRESAFNARLSLRSIRVHTYATEGFRLLQDCSESKHEGQHTRMHTHTQTHTHTSARARRILAVEKWTSQLKPSMFPQQCAGLKGSSRDGRVLCC